MDYYNQPTHKPYSRDHFAIASLLMGIFAILLSCTVVFSLPLAGLSFLFAALAYRKGKLKKYNALGGIILSCVALIATSVLFIYTVTSDVFLSTYREQMNIVSEQLYGISFDELLNQTILNDLAK